MNWICLLQMKVKGIIVIIHITIGEVTEWPNVPVSKTGVGQPTGGSNPPLSAVGRRSL